MAGPPVSIEDVPEELRKAVYSMYDQCSWIVDVLEETILYYRLKRKERGLSPDKAEAGEAYIVGRIDENEIYRVPIRMMPYLLRFLSVKGGFNVEVASYDIKLSRIQNMVVMLHTIKELLDEFVLAVLSQPAEYTYMMMQLVGNYKGKYSDLATALQKVPLPMKIWLLEGVGKVCAEYKDMNFVEYLKGKMKKKIVEELAEDFGNYTIIEYLREGLWERYNDKISFYVAGLNPVSIKVIESLIMLIDELQNLQIISVDVESLLKNYKERLRLRFMCC